LETNPSQAELERCVLECLATEYGIGGELERLGGENINFKVTTADGGRFVFKILDASVPTAVIDMEFRAIEHALAANIPLDLPKIIQNKTGNIYTGINIRSNERNNALLMYFINGKTLENHADISIKLLKNLGESVASFDRVMKNFDHPAAHRGHAWSLIEAGRHRDKIHHVKEPEKRELLNWAFDIWAARAQPILERLPSQFIHGDINPANVLVRGDTVVGLIDFGDSCVNPAICELAICLTYLMMGREDPLAAARIVIDGYETVRTLSDAARDVLLPLICVRLAVSVSMSAQRRTIDPGRPGWFASEAMAWELLAFLRRGRLPTAAL
jgi:Ser/Thr protein kinase RdoA (MazF antagonist)